MTREVSVHPCANCGRAIDPAPRRKVFCGDLCRQVARDVRYFTLVSDDGRIDDPDVRAALRMKLAFIGAGGYDETRRSLTKAQRAAVTERDGGKCRQCGGSGSEIDHIVGSRNDLDNLQLLCRDCHQRKTELSMVPAGPDVLDVYRAFDERAGAMPHQQPCDMRTWNHREWGKDPIADEARAAWFGWASGIEPVPLTPALAVAGFPSGLDPWVWYAGDHVERWEVGGISIAMHPMKD